MLREKMFIEYPLCLSYKQAIAWLEAGHELWQEDSNDFPECGGFDDIDCFKDNFPDEDIDWSDGIHLVPKDPEMIEDSPFKVGDFVVCLEEQGYACGQDEDDKISEGEVCKIDNIRDNNYLNFYEHSDRYGPWNPEYFASTENVVFDGVSITHAQRVASKDIMEKYGVDFTFPEIVEVKCENHCPKCGAGDIEWCGMDICEGFIKQPATCNKCGEEFVEYSDVIYSSTEYDAFK